MTAAKEEKPGVFQSLMKDGKWKAPALALTAAFAAAIAGPEVVNAIAAVPPPPIVIVPPMVGHISGPLPPVAEAFYGAVMGGMSMFVLGLIIGAEEGSAGLGVVGGVAGGVIAYNYGLDSVLYPGLFAVAAGIIVGAAGVFATVAAVDGINKNRSKMGREEVSEGAEFGAAGGVGLAAAALAIYGVMSWLGPQTENTNHNTNPPRPAAESNYSPLLGQQ